MSFKVEKNIETPEGKTKYPWASMKPGDSFFVPTDDPRTTARLIGPSGYGWMKRNSPGHGVRVKMEEGGVRIWMVVSSENSK